MKELTLWNVVPTTSFALNGAARKYQKRHAKTSGKLQELVGLKASQSLIKKLPAVVANRIAEALAAKAYQILDFARLTNARTIELPIQQSRNKPALLTKIAKKNAACPTVTHPTSDALHLYAHLLSHAILKPLTNDVVRNSTVSHVAVSNLTTELNVVNSNVLKAQLATKTTVASCALTSMTARLSVVRTSLHASRVLCSIAQNLSDSSKRTMPNTVKMTMTASVNAVVRSQLVQRLVVISYVLPR